MLTPSFEFGASIKHIAEAAMQPAFAGRVIAPAVDVLVEYVRVVPIEPRDFLLETELCVLHERGVALMPQLAVPLDRPVYTVARSFDHMLVHDFAIKRRQFLMPVHDLQCKVSGGSHGRLCTGMSSPSAFFSRRSQLDQSLFAHCGLRQSNSQI